MPKRQDHPELYESFLWETAEAVHSEERLAAIARMVCNQYPVSRATECRAAFYPYTGLKSTIKIDRGLTRIRISDILQDAPDSVLEALVHILLSRAGKRKPPPCFLDRYREYLQTQSVESRHADTRAQRIKKQLPGPKGHYYDLTESFNELNTCYFDHTIPPTRLSWSPNRSRRQLGYHDEHLNLIVISRWLDRKVVPSYVVDFVMYHEMLHIVVPTQYRNGRRIIHSKEFRRRERQYAYYKLAKAWLGG